MLETAAFEDVELTADLMQRCRSLGAQFALDDFGTGYSTLTYLKRLPVDVLKIDRSFVRSMLADAQDLAIVEGVIGLSRTFGCSVVGRGRGVGRTRAATRGPGLRDWSGLRHCQPDARRPKLRNGSKVVQAWTSGRASADNLLSFDLWQGPAWPDSQNGLVEFAIYFAQESRHVCPPNPYTRHRSRLPGPECQP